MTSTKVFYSTKNKIAMMEAKLRQMERTPLGTVASSSKNASFVPRLSASGNRSATQSKPSSLVSPSDSLSSQSIFPRQPAKKQQPATKEGVKGS